MIEVEDLWKSYGNVVALRGITFRIPKGKIFTVLGPNGAGKTTLLKILAGLIKRDRGKVRILGRDPRKEKIRELFYIPDSLSRLPEDLTVFDAVRIRARLRDLSLDGLQEYAEVLGLREFLNVQIAKLSSGNKQKVFLLMAFISEPQILLADEPTAMLDPLTREELLDTFRHMAAQGTTIFFSSHVLREVESIADRVIVLNAGRKVFEGTIIELYKLYESDTYEVITNDNVRLMEALKEEFEVRLEGERLIIKGDPERIRRKVPEYIHKLSLELYRFVPTRAFRTVMEHEGARC